MKRCYILCQMLSPSFVYLLQIIAQNSRFKIFNSQIKFIVYTWRIWEMRTHWFIMLVFLFKVQSSIFNTLSVCCVVGSEMCQANFIQLRNGSSVSPHKFPCDSKYPTVFLFL